MTLRDGYKTTNQQKRPLQNGDKCLSKMKEKLKLNCHTDDTARERRAERLAGTENLEDTGKVEKGKTQFKVMEKQKNAPHHPTVTPK